MLGRVFVTMALGLSLSIHTDAHAQASTTDLLADARRLEAEAEFEAAAAALERFAKDRPRDAGAADALARALVLRLGTGAETIAAEDLTLFQTNHGESDSAKLALLVVRLATFHADRARFGEAQKLIADAQPLIDTKAAAGVAIRAHLVLSRCHQGLGDLTKAREERKLGLARFDKADLRGEEKTDKEAAFAAVADALLVSAEEARATSDAIAFPLIEGLPNRDGVMKHMRTTVAAWFKKRIPALESTVDAFEKISELGPLAPSRTVVASKAAIAFAWRNIVREPRAAPVPASWKGATPLPGTPDFTTEDLRGMYYALLDEVTEPQKLRARKAHIDCVETSRRLATFGPRRACEDWLQRNYGSEFLEPEPALSFAPRGFMTLDAEFTAWMPNEPKKSVPTP